MEKYVNKMEKFVKPEMVIVLFDAEDVITTSDTPLIDGGDINSDNGSNFGDLIGW